MGALDAINLVLALLTQAAAISQKVAQAQAEGRDLTDEDWKSITDADNAARKALQDAIDKA